ncbi:MAG: WG repeat-containing protein [Bacteroidetes bacterium]|nr:WG repeat-containing protein [Bacteroidota bacterium]
MKNLVIDHIIIRQQTICFIILLLLISSLTNQGQTIVKKDFLVAFNDTIKGGYGYKDHNGTVVIPIGKYPMVFSDTFRTYAIVASPEKGFVTINRQEQVLYEVFPYDNGPDYISDGLFRIIANKKIGFADSATGKVMIIPQFDCARPFENGLAEVSTNCKSQVYGDNATWISDNWYYIDKTGRKIDKPDTNMKQKESVAAPDSVKPVYLDHNDTIYITIYKRVAVDLRQKVDTGSIENKLFAAKMSALTPEQQNQLEPIFVKSITEYAAKTHFEAWTLMMNFNNLARKDVKDIADKYEIRVQNLGDECYAAEFWEALEQGGYNKVMALLYVREKDGSFTFHDPYQAVIDFLNQ